jgi:hypothetical protein
VTHLPLVRDEGSTIETLFLVEERPICENRSGLRNVRAMKSNADLSFSIFVKRKNADFRISISEFSATATCGTVKRLICLPLHAQLSTKYTIYSTRNRDPAYSTAIARANFALSEHLNALVGKCMENGYDKVAGYVMVVVGVGIALFFLYRFSVTVLPWLILIAGVIGAIWFFWRHSMKRSAHPWD